MSFSYYDKDNNIKRLNIEVGKEWSSYKEKDENSLMNSVFDAVDQNSDGKVDENELNILQKLLKIADSQIEKLKNNNKIEQEELELFVEKVQTLELKTLKGNEHPSIITPKIIKIPDDIDKLKNYSFFDVDAIWEESDYDSKKIVQEVAVDYSLLKNLDKGKYYIDSWKESFDKQNMVLVLTPVVRKVNDISNIDGIANWSEGINRIITKIQFDKINCDSTLLEFMNKIGEEQGFTVELLDVKDPWIEDLSVVRADKKQLIPNSDTDAKMRIYDNENKIISKRSNITISAQGSAMQTGNKTDTPNAEIYSNIISTDDVIQGKTYLEGGNVLNTLTKNGEPAAIIGEESIQYTICAMLGLELGDSIDAIKKVKEIISDNQEEYINRAKKQIAKELGIKEEYVTYIPQFDFHIDMHYRPLNDGQIAVPDYEAGINVLKDFIHKIDNEIEETKSNYTPDFTGTNYNNPLSAKREMYQNLIQKLEEMKTKTAEISQEAENELKKQGYEIIKIPCFTEIDKGFPVPDLQVKNPINYMNGICGTSAKTGNKFYITNTSGDEALDAYMENYFKEVVGFDKVYFAPTKNYLNAKGGIDCLTKEF